MSSIVALARPGRRSCRGRRSEQLGLGLAGVLGGHADRALGLAEAVEVVAVALVEVAVEGLLLGEALVGVGADRGAHVAEHRRRLAAASRGAALDVLAGAGGELGGHPVEEDAVVLGAGEGAHLRAHRGQDEADARERLAQGGQRLAHRRQRLLREARRRRRARAGSRSRPSRSMSAAISSGPWRSRAITATPSSIRSAPRGEVGERLEALGAGVVVGPHRRVAELLAAGGERRGDLGVEPGGDAEAALGVSLRRSSSATHSMCGVWGNMSTGCTRRSL